MIGFGKLLIIFCSNIVFALATHSSPAFARLRGIEWLATAPAYARNNILAGAAYHVFVYSIYSNISSKLFL